ncbi:hypothetical protein [Aliarcobacter butzleri]|uniref:hypothetical protein n=1 Tax=Aliarcobacter butzleri TaxID=28197 RepID=UPI0021B17ADB|nr:hypothetical protein [Aliarcobacter butzleri]MCT7562357.1 hypothetical protein [Aliarcobacter butzleri]
MSNYFFSFLFSDFTNFNIVIFYVLFSVARSEWLDEKLVTLDKYKDSLNLNDNNSSLSNQEKFYLKKLQDVKQKVYNDSFSDFLNFYKKLNNVDLGKLDFIQLDFSNSNLQEENIDDILKQNIKLTIDILFKSNNILKEIVLNLKKVLKDDYNYESFDNRDKELIKEALCLAKFIQNICICNYIDYDLAYKFINIITTIEKSF